MTHEKARGADWAQDHMELELQSAKAQLEILEDILYSPESRDALGHQLLLLSHSGNLLFNLFYSPGHDTK